MRQITVGSYLGIAMFMSFLPWTIRGDLDILLSGYDHIPSDGSGQVEIPDIGTHADGAALVCRHNITGIPPSSGIDNWYYINEAGQQESVDSAGTGWSVSRGQNDGVVRLERLQGVQPLEGNYSCVVERTNPTRFDTVTLYLYWPITRVEVMIEVISQQSQQYNVTCMSEGGSVQSSSFTGPAGGDLGHLQPVEEEPDMRGADNYSISVIRTGGTHGDTFQCMASNGDSTGTSSLALSVAGSPVNVSAVQVSSASPTLNISWSPPLDGAVVTGYSIYYSGTDNDGTEQEGTHADQTSTYLLMHYLIADGRTYEITIEAHSVHLYGYSELISYEPCFVLQPMLASQTSNSLFLSWERPDYYTGSITGLMQYRAVPDGSTVWLYVEDSDDIPSVTGLNEFTNYSIEIALIDSNKLCVPSATLFAVTDLGPVRSLTAQATGDAIEITWSPPNIPTELIVYYEVTYQRVNSGESNDDLMTTITTQSASLSIPASQGDQYSVTVTAHTETGPGDSSTITAGVDYVSFQLRIDEIGRCADWIKGDQLDSKVSDISSEVERALNLQCNCDVRIRMEEVYCYTEEQDFAIFRGQLFAPLTTTSAALLATLEDWAASGPSVGFTNSRNINSDCQPSANVDDLTCLMMGEGSTIASSVAASSDETNDMSTTVLAGVAAGSLIVGVLFTVVGILMCYIIKKRYTPLAGVKHADRHLPNLPSDAHEGKSLTITNPTVQGACGYSEIETSSNEAYGTVKSPSTGDDMVTNPLYGDSAASKGKSSEPLKDVYELVDLPRNIASVKPSKV